MIKDSELVIGLVHIECSYYETQTHLYQIYLYAYLHTCTYINIYQNVAMNLHSLITYIYIYTYMHVYILYTNI